MWKFLTSKYDNNLCSLAPIYFLALYLKFLKWRNLVVYDFRATIVFLYKIQMSQSMSQVHLSQISIHAPLSSLFQRKNNIIRNTLYYHHSVLASLCITSLCIISLQLASINLRQLIIILFTFAKLCIFLYIIIIKERANKFYLSIDETIIWCCCILTIIERA